MAARVASGPSVKALQTDLERKAASPPEALAASVAEWAKLLEAHDDTPRYEDPEGGPALSFRAAFLGSQAFEILLAAAGTRGGVAVPESAAAAWKGVMRGSAVSGGEDLALQLPELFAKSRPFPDCRQLVEEAAALLKADAQNEAVRSRCAAAGTRAEEIRTALRTKGRSTAPAGVAAIAAREEACQSSAEAVKLYTSFRDGLDISAARLRDVKAERLQRVAKAQEALQRMWAEAAARQAEASSRRAEAAVQRDAAAAPARRAVEELEQDGQRLECDAQAQKAEEQKRQAQIQLEEVAQALAAKRKEHAELLQRRDEAVAEHRRRTEAIERQLQELRPARFHEVVTPRAEHMTEGEIVAGLAHSSDAVAKLSHRALAALDEACGRRGGELETQRKAIEQQAQSHLQKHAKLQLARVEAASATVRETVSALMRLAHSRAELRAMGLSPEEEGLIPSRKDVKRLQEALLAARDAWEEAVGLWNIAQDAAAGTSSGDPGALLAAPQAKARAPAMLQALEVSRGRISQILAPLQRVDPAVYDLAVLGIGAEEEEASLEEAANALDPTGEALPHGWEAHVAHEGHVYYYNQVSQQSQWEPPDQDAATSVGWRLLQADTGAWFYHNPYDDSGVWWPELPSGPAALSSLDALRHDLQ